MAVMTIRIPEDVKEAFDKAFEGQDKDAIIAELMRGALASRAAGQEAVPSLVERFRELRKDMPSISQDEIRRLRDEGRH